MCFHILHVIILKCKKIGNNIIQYLPVVVLLYVHIPYKSLFALISQTEKVREIDGTGLLGNLHKHFLHHFKFDRHGIQKNSVF